MPQQIKCQYCNTYFIGRPNQNYCSNAHKAKAFRLREKSSQSKYLNTEKPVSFVFFKPLSSYEKKSPDICIELNLIKWVIDSAEECFNILGVWECGDMVNYFNQEIQSNIAFERRVLEKMENETYSTRFISFIKPHLSEIIQTSKQIRATLKKTLKKYNCEEAEQKVEVEFDEFFKDKMLTIASKYNQLWLSYKNKYL